MMAMSTLLESSKEGGKMMGQTWLERASPISISLDVHSGARLFKIGVS